MPATSTKTVKLRQPIKFGDLSYTELKLREPYANELETASMERTSIGVVMKLISLVSKTPRKAIGMLCNRDLQECADFLGRFTDYKKCDETSDDEDGEQSVENGPTDGTSDESAGS